MVLSKMRTLSLWLCLCLCFAGCRQSPRPTSPETIKAIRAMLVNDARVAGARISYYTDAQDNGRILVVLIDASPKQLARASKEWPTVDFESGGLIKGLTKTVP